MTEHHLRVQRSSRYFTCGDARSPDRWMVLHGYGELASDFLAHFQDFGAAYFVAPEGLSRFYLPQHRRVGASWMTREYRLAEIEDYVAFLNAVNDETSNDSAALTVLGFSQGAHTACRWAVGGQQTVRRLVLWGSRMPEDLDESAVVSALGSSDVVFVVGSDDKYVATEDIESEVRRVERMGIAASLIRYQGGHEIDPQVVRELVEM